LHTLLPGVSEGQLRQLGFVFGGFSWLGHKRLPYSLALGQSDTGKYGQKNGSAQISDKQSGGITKMRLKAFKKMVHSQAIGIMLATAGHESIKPL